MKITQIQMDIAWGDIEANCQTASALIDAAPGSDLYILPEMFSTGFATEPEGMADDQLTSLHWMQRKAQQTGAAVCGSVATKCVDGTYHNRFYFVTPDEAATPVFYDKHHLFTYGNEHLRYTAGDERVVVAYRGVRFLLQVCYDLRFPVFARNSKGDDGYDAIIYVASWPTVRIEPWRALLKARAIENQCYVYGVDRIGNDPSCSYCGGTEAIDPYGKVLAACPDNEACTITTLLDMNALQDFRRKFPVLEDAD